jgi:hypothetical protein
MDSFAPESLLDYVASGHDWGKRVRWFAAMVRDELV